MIIDSTITKESTTALRNRILNLLLNRQQTEGIESLQSDQELLAMRDAAKHLKQLEAFLDILSQRNDLEEIAHASGLEEGKRIGYAQGVESEKQRIRDALGL